MRERPRGVAARGRAPRAEPQEVAAIWSIRTKVGVALAVGAAAIAATALARGTFEGARARTAAGMREHPPARVGVTPRRILVLTETRGYHHASIPAAIAALRRLDAADHRLALTFLPGAAALTPGRLQGAGAVVFLLTSGELPLADAGKRALVAFVRGGGGLVGVHSAADTFHHWRAYLALIGAEFSHHPHPSVQRVIVEDRVTPATHALPPSFRIDEEFYVFKHDPRPHVHVLARLDTGASGPDRPLIWCRRAGKGRVFYDALGHFDATWSDQRQLEIVAGALDWAAGAVGGGDCR